MLEKLESALDIGLVFLVSVCRQTESGVFEIGSLPKDGRAVPSELNTDVLPARFYEFTDII